MLNGYGWCLLRARKPADSRALEADPDRRDKEVDETDSELWQALRVWIEAVGDPFLLWNLSDHNNNDRGVLTFSISRNHRSSAVWEMLDWIVTHGPGSYGLFFVHDDESVGEGSNRFRVHRLLHGELMEMDDPFFGEIWPNLED